MPPSPNAAAIRVIADAFGEKGVRKQMEDVHLICNSISSIIQQIKKKFDFSLYAIMDGHGGSQCAEFVKEFLPFEIASQFILLQNEDEEGDEEGLSTHITDKQIKNVINAAFSKIDSRIATEIPSCKDGCTVVLVLMNETNVYISSLGDSAAYLCRRNADGLHAIPLTETHKPWVIKEKERIIKFGGSMENGRVNGSLEVTRSFGDISLKKYGVLCTPTFRKFTVDAEKDQFILLGCDGFWSCISSLDIVTMAADMCVKELKRNEIPNGNLFDAKSICKQLVEHIIVDKKSQDNVSVLMIYFDKNQ